jgi:TPR repeat protein
MNQLLRQVQQGDAEAQRLLGMVNDPAFEAGPWPKDQQSAREWYKSAATEGDAEAAARLGLMLAAPSSPAVDQPEARQWLAKAAQSGESEAALRLAELLLDEGESSPARAQAVELLKTAAAKPETEGFANALLRDLGYQAVLSSNP